MRHKKVCNAILALLRQKKGGVLQPVDGNVIDQAWRHSSVDNIPRWEFAEAVDQCIEKGQVREICDQNGCRIGLELVS